MSRLASWRRSVVLAGLLASVTVFCAPARADYELGHGFNAFDGRLTIGGNFSLEAEFLDDTPDRLLIDNLNTFLRSASA